MDGKKQKENIKKSEEFVFKHPQWKLSLQTHKIIGIP
jgi:organic radical activating enzyme